MSGTTGQEREGFSFEQLYSNGKVYVFPPVFESKIKDKQWKKNLPEEAPIDPKEFSFNNTSSSGRGRRLGRVEAIKEAGLKNAESNMKGEKAEYNVIIMIKTLLEKATKANDPPVFVLNNLKAGSSEKDIYIFSRKFGVVVVEVKAADNVQGSYLQKHLEKAVEQLKGARAAVMKELKGLLKPEGVKLAIALPNLLVDKEEDVRQLAEEIFQKNPDLGVVMGQEASVYQAWLESLVPGADSDIWDTRGQVDGSDATFKEAAEKYLSVVRVHVPGGEMAQVAEQHKNWLLTPKQMEVRDSTANILHMWGPPGAGKTLLLLHRARRWLYEGKSVILATGSALYDLLKTHLGRAMLRGQEKTFSRLRICRDSDDLKIAVEEWGERELCIVADELHSDAVFQAIVKAVKEGKVKSCWSADGEDVTAKSELSAIKRQLGWKAEQLKQSIRCPQHVVHLLNRLVADSTRHRAIEVLNVPRPCPISSYTTVIDHCSHQHFIRRPPNTEPRYRLWRELQCIQCRDELSATHQITDRDSERWRQWVVIHTGSNDDRSLQVTAKTLCEFPIPCVFEPPARFPRPPVPVSYLLSETHDQKSEVNSLSSTSLSYEEEKEQAAWQERVVSGLDKAEKPAVHVVSTADFRGLEKAGVLLLHYDEDDFDPEQQSPDDNTERLERHREQWFQAASRCQGHLITLITSSSPARSLLQPPEYAGDHGDRLETGTPNRSDDKASFDDEQEERLLQRWFQQQW